ncbi:hypothetical protein ABW21_db0204538 [Orbilia brochopaga]|nr:hypothetical protein ABW21_db0204538 [Drechslerella brochopaga]
MASTTLGRCSGSGKTRVLISSSTPMPFCINMMVESRSSLSLIFSSAGTAWCAFVVTIRLRIGCSRCGIQYSSESMTCHSKPVTMLATRSRSTRMRLPRRRNVFLTSCLWKRRVIGGGLRSVRRLWATRQPTLPLPMM